jgi:dodecin
MGDSVYKIIEVVGTSRNSWEDAARNAVKAAGMSVRDLRIAEITKLDTVIDKGEVVAFRARVSLSFKYDIAAKAKPKTKGKGK